MDQVPKDAVVFLSQPTPHINAVFGGLMALRAQRIGAAGAVVDGRLRDLQEHRDLEFPVSIYRHRIRGATGLSNSNSCDWRFSQKA